MFSQSKIIEWTFFPLMILMQTVPIVVVSPLLLIVFTVLGWGPEDPLPLIGMGSKPILVVTILISFFPTLVNMTIGLQNLDPNLYEFMQLVNSSKLRQRGGLFNIPAAIIERWRLLWKLRLPSSVPYLFASFRITSSLCFVGAVVGEYFLATTTGIGGLLNLYIVSNDQPGLWAATIAVSACSMIFFGLVIIAERILVPWREER
jgi:NitT/TauT family transport system permease protein